VDRSFEDLNRCVLGCRRCPRLVHFRETVPAKKALENAFHYRLPVPGFGDHQAQLLIVGLAPSVDGGNRTGRIFTGDISARFLMQMLYEEGFANQPISESKEDGLQLLNCYMTASVKCVPPGHKPLKIELINCNAYYATEFRLLKRLTCVLALGKFAFDAHLHYLKAQGREVKGIRFQHGAIYEFEGAPTLFGAYHPSPQNTHTGKLTPAMFKQVLNIIKKYLYR
jgi:uracil-DNA glycosylase